MNTTLSAETLELFAARLDAADAAAISAGPRQPVHTVYGGAHLFKAATAAKLGELARRSFNENLAGPEDLAELFNIDTRHAGTVFGRVAEKLASEPIEDLRLDFEDGYGTRPDTEEDGHAVQAAGEMAKAALDGTLPPFIGIRIKSFSREARRRAIRTLDLFLTTYSEVSGVVLPPNFVVTLPKVSSPAETSLLADVLEELESKLRFPTGSVLIEVMVETPSAIIAPDGRSALRSIVEAARGRCRGAHFGAYDYTANLGITSKYQDMLHPACDFARAMMLVSLAGTGIWLSDGATNVMPIGPHRGGDLTAEQASENRETIRRAWQLHYRHCRNSLANGFYQGWDLHPAQLPTRYAAIYAMFHEELESSGLRLRGFIEKAAQASLVGDQFDDAATGQGLLNFFVRGLNCGALTADEATLHSGLSQEQLSLASFALITGVSNLAS